MGNMIARRKILKAGLTGISLTAIGLPAGTFPTWAEGETPVPFLDIPESIDFSPDPNAPLRYFDIRTIDGLLTPKDRFFTVQHLRQPEIDVSTYRLKVTGLVSKPVELSLEDIRKRPSTQLAAGFECWGNTADKIHGLVSNGMWTGIHLRDLLSSVGVRPEGREVIFFGADRGEAEIPYRGQKFKVDQNFARSVSIDNAMKSEPILAYALNGDPLTRRQGSPLRLIMPGWYGVCNVKWLSQIHIQAERFIGEFQARSYMSIRGETVNGQVIWKETEVTRMHLKSVIAKVTRSGNRHLIHGFVLNDGTPLKSVEVRVDNGPWGTAALDRSNTQYSWKLFTYVWEDATPGEHTLVSRVTDVNGNVQPTAADLEVIKKTHQEDNAQFPRRVKIS